MPNRVTVNRWLEKDADFASKYARAREQQADFVDDRITDVAEGVLRGEIDPHAGKVAIGAFQWRASKLQPKKYGDAQLLKHADPDGNPLKIQVTGVQPTPENT